MNDAVVYGPDNWSASPLEHPDAHLVGGRCAACGRAWFPRAEVCPGCLATGPMLAIPLSPTGTLYAYSIVHIAPAGFKAPYAIGYVDLPDGVRVFGHLDIESDSRPAFGSPVRIYGGVIGRTPGGEPLVGIRFAPADGAGKSKQKEQAHARAS